MDLILINTSTFAVEEPVLLEELKKSGLTCVLNPFKRKLTEPEVQGLIEEHQPVGILAGLEPFTRTVMSKARNLKCISRVGIGMDNVDLEAAKQLSIIVRNTPAAPVPAVAELTIGMLLNQMRQISVVDREIRKGKWTRPYGSLLNDKVVGVVGLGRIGTAVAQLLKAFGCRVLGTDPIVTRHDFAKLVPIEELWRSSDIVTVHVPGGSATRHLIDTKAIARMKRGVVIVNASRGDIIDEAALIEGLRSGQVGGACIDTFEQEPYAGPLIEFEQVVLTPHVGSYAKEARVRMEREAVSNLLTALGKG